MPKFAFKCLMMGLALAACAGCHIGPCCNVPTTQRFSFGPDTGADLSSQCDSWSSEDCSDYCTLSAHLIGIREHLTHIPCPKPGALWKSHRQLPKGPQEVRFHPVPTRPVFQPREAAAVPLLDCDSIGNFGDASRYNYGQMPSGPEWNFSRVYGNELPGLEIDVSVQKNMSTQ